MSAANYTRESLLERLKNSRDQLSWGEFCLAYERYIYFIIRGMAIGHHDAKDITQDVLIGIWQNIPDYKYSPDRAKFRTWVCRIARNKVVDFIRKKTAEHKRLEKVSAYQDLQAMSLPQVEAIAKVEWKAHITDSAWNNIKDDFRGCATDCFEMMNQGLLVVDISHKLGISESSVYVYKKRVKDKLISEIRRLEQNWA